MLKTEEKKEGKENVKKWKWRESKDITTTKNTIMTSRAAGTTTKKNESTLLGGGKIF